MIRNNGNDPNVSSNDIKRFNRVRQTAKRYISNARQKLGLDYFAANRIRYRAASNENKRLSGERPLYSSDFSQYGDAQVSRRQYMGLSNG